MPFVLWFHTCEMLTVVQTLCEAWWDLWGRILKGSYRKIVKRLMGAKETPNLMQMKKVVCFWEGSWYHWLSKIMRLSYCELRRKWSESRSVMSDSLSPDGLYSSWNSPGQNTGVGSLSPLQGIFSTQGLNSGLLHCMWILYQLSHKGSPRILERVAYLFSRGSS